jgi:hypothetical protein
MVAVDWFGAKTLEQMHEILKKRVQEREVKKGVIQV